LTAAILARAGAARAAFALISAGLTALALPALLVLLAIKILLAILVLTVLTALIHLIAALGGVAPLILLSHHLLLLVRALRARCASGQRLATTVDPIVTPPYQPD
jgi:hypothetical protein